MSMFATPRWRHRSHAWPFVYMMVFVNIDSAPFRLADVIGSGIVGPDTTIINRKVNVTQLVSMRFLLFSII